ncbi:hypothetical protein ACX0G9_29090 [Flavitalea flava]
MNKGNTEKLFAKIEAMCKPYLLERFGWDPYKPHQYKGFREIAKKANVEITYKGHFSRERRN